VGKKGGKGANGLWYLEESEVLGGVETLDQTGEYMGGVEGIC